MNILTLIGLGILSESLTWARPFRWILHQFGVDTYDEHATPLEKFFQELFSCELCIGFWVGLVWTFSLPQAAIVMCFARLSRALLDSLPTKI